MPGLACFTLSVGLIGLRMGLERIAYALMVVGSLLILCGFAREITIPAITWYLGRIGKFDRALKRRIKAGATALRGPVDEETFLAWERTSEAMLSAYLGGLWHPWFAKFNAAGMTEGNEGFGHERKLYIAKQMAVLSDLRRMLREDRNSVVIFPTRLKV
jgi:hypothetical protein